MNVRVVLFQMPIFGFFPFFMIGHTYSREDIWALRSPVRTLEQHPSQASFTHGWTTCGPLVNHL